MLLPSLGWGLSEFLWNLFKKLLNEARVIMVFLKNINPYFKGDVKGSNDHGNSRDNTKPKVLSRNLPKYLDKNLF